MVSTDRLKLAIVAPKSPVLQITIVLATTALAGGVRWGLDRGANGVPFATFLPFVVLATIFLDWPYAVLAAVLGGIAGAGFIYGSPLNFPVALKLASVAAYCLTASFVIVVGLLLRQTVKELDDRAQDVDTVNKELQHRAGNALQMIQALASRCRNVPPEEFYRALSGRLEALAKANALLGLDSNASCDIAQLVEQAMKPFDCARLTINGPSCTLRNEQGHYLMLGLHELATNATKYGALSSEEGTVTIDWHHDAGMVLLRWKESGGPPVNPPQRRGLGSRILTPSRALKAVDLRFPRGGVECEITFEGRPSC